MNDILEVPAPTHPALTDLLAFWESKRPASGLPLRRDFEPQEMRQHLPFLYIFEALPGCEDFRTRLVGTSIASTRGRDVTGQLLSGIMADVPKAFTLIRDAMRRAALSGRPVFLRGRTFWLADKEFLRFESSYLPLAGNHEGEILILGATYYDLLG